MLCGYTVYVLEKLANKQTQDRRIIHLAALKCGVKPNPSVYEMNKQFFVVTVLELSCQGKQTAKNLVLIMRDRNHRPVLYYLLNTIENKVHLLTLGHSSGDNFSSKFIILLQEILDFSDVS